MSSSAPASKGFVSVKLIHDPKDASGASLKCADVFVIGGTGSDLHSIWTEPESGTFWPRDLVPNDVELKDSCRVWTLELHDVDANLHHFQNCIPLQNFGAGSLNAIDHSITSDALFAVAKEDADSSGEKKPNNGVIILIGHGLGGILAEVISSLILELPSATFQGHHLGLKQKHWRLVLFGTPFIGEESNILHDLDQILGIVSYYGGSGQGCDIHHTRGFWKGLQQHSLCLVNNDWVNQGLQAPSDSHGTLKVASFQEGEQDDSLAQQWKSRRPNDPNTNGFVVQPSYSLFGSEAMCGFSMADPPSPELPRQHKHMGQFKDLSDPGYVALRTILKGFVVPE